MCVQIFISGRNNNMTMTSSDKAHDSKATTCNVTTTTTCGICHQKRLYANANCEEMCVQIIIISSNNNMTMTSSDKAHDSTAITCNVTTTNTCGICHKKRLYANANCEEMCVQIFISSSNNNMTMTSSDKAHDSTAITCNVTTTTTCGICHQKRLYANANCEEMCVQIFISSRNNNMTMTSSDKAHEFQTHAS